MEAESIPNCWTELTAREQMTKLGCEADRLGPAPVGGFLASRRPAPGRFGDVAGMGPHPRCAPQAAALPNTALDVPLQLTDRW